ncbi:hypothetical protein EON80_31680 [bacterium]|nr:MAG: hypothetical protein EON80_31680 [bacterium]
MSAGTATQIFLTSGDGQTGTVASLLPQAFTVTLKDSNDNVVNGATVVWTIAAGTYRVQLARSASEPVQSAEVNLQAAQLP